MSRFASLMTSSGSPPVTPSSIRHKTLPLPPPISTTNTNNTNNTNTTAIIGSGGTTLTSTRQQHHADYIG